MFMPDMVVRSRDLGVSRWMVEVFLGRWGAVLGVCGFFCDVNWWPRCLGLWWLVVMLILVLVVDLFVVLSRGFVGEGSEMSRCCR